MWTACSLCLVVGLAARETRTFDGGVFTVTLQLDPEDWRVSATPDKNFVHFQHLAAGGLGPGTAAEFYVFVTKVADTGATADLPALLPAYLARRDTVLLRDIFGGSRKFTAAKGNPVTVGPHRLMRYDARSKTLSRLSADIKQREEGMVYFLAPADFEQHQVAVLFTGRESLSDQPGSVSALAILEDIIRGFAFKPAPSP